jgi:hypothetical protein
MVRRLRPDAMERSEIAGREAAATGTEAEEGIGTGELERALLNHCIERRARYE